MGMAVHREPGHPLTLHAVRRATPLGWESTPVLTIGKDTLCGLVAPDNAADIACELCSEQLLDVKLAESVCIRHFHVYLTMSYLLAEAVIK